MPEGLQESARLSWIENYIWVKAYERAEKEEKEEIKKLSKLL
jgi:hypothetical protein